MNHNAGRLNGSALPQAPLYVVDGFYDNADVLRHEFEQQIPTTTRSYSGVTPFTYAFYQDAYQFLTSSAERIFSPAILADFIKKIGQWAENTLGTSHVSTPQARIYILGCARGLLLDDVAMPWHYMFSLTRTPGRNLSEIKIANSIEQGKGIEQLARARLKFNQLLIHKTTGMYSVSPGKRSMNPVDGTILLDGYLW